MKKFITVAAVAASLIIAAPAHAVDRIPSTTTIKVLPGHGYRFHEGDPIRVCAMTITATITDRPVHIVLESRAGDHPWSLVADLVGYPDTTLCLYGTVHDTATGASQLRARTLQNPAIARSNSRVVTINVAG